VNRRNQGLLIGLAFLLSISLTAVFAFRAGRHARHMRFESESIRPWMSVPFIAHTHHVPADPLFEAIGLPPHPHDRRPLRRIAHDENRPVSELISRLEQAIAAARPPGVEPATPGRAGPR
jgi:hypothetical protein